MDRRFALTSMLINANNGGDTAWPALSTGNRASINFDLNTLYIVTIVLSIQYDSLVFTLKLIILIHIRLGHLVTVGFIGIYEY